MLPGLTEHLFDFAQIYELLNPGAILETGVGGDSSRQQALQDFIKAAGEVFARSDLRLQESGS
jgi:hypothetical protein